MKYIKSFLAAKLPWLLMVKAWFVALKDHSTKTKDSYSQSGEDQLVHQYLKDVKPEDGFYVDVGANHPTRLSNTYRFYRKGWSGLVIEPCRPLLTMHRVFRSRDMQLAIGCGKKTQVLHFRHAVSHVLSGFDSEGLKAKAVRETELMPVLPLDKIIDQFADIDVSLLSVDVEGYDFQVA